MGVEGVAKCMKYTLIIFNAIFVILGAVCLGLGIWILVDKEQLMELAKINSDSYDVPSLLQQGAYVLLGGGGFMFLIGIFGCVGACKESRILLGVYGGLVLIVFILELVAGILAAVFHGEIEDKLKTYLTDALDDKYYGTWDTNSAFSLAVDYIQLEYDCCGVNNHTDYENTKNWKASAGNVIPFTCCKFSNKDAYPDNPKDLKPTDPTCPGSSTDANSWRNKGCYNTVRTLLEDNAKILIGVGVGVALIELLGVIFAFYVCCKLGEQNKVY